MSENCKDAFGTYEITKSCKVCINYKRQEIGDSDYGAIYSEAAICKDCLDCFADDMLIPDFDREVGRDCCEIDFWLVLERDEDMSKVFNNGEGEPNYCGALRLFEDKYVNQTLEAFCKGDM